MRKDLITQQKLKISPLAPKIIKKLLSPIGIDVYVYCARLYNNKRNDLVIFHFNRSGSISEVFTQSSLRSCTLDWNKKNLATKTVDAIIVNSGNANTFTGQQGINSLHKISESICKKFKVSKKNLFFASTGVIGERFPVEKILNTLNKKKAVSNKWIDSAKSIMTTDTFPKGISRKIKIDHQYVTITGIAKGSGMIEPNMATMLGFIFMDLEVPQKILQILLKKLVSDSFNKISVDGDESTNDTVIMCSSNRIKLKKPIKSFKDKRINLLEKKLIKIFKFLSEQIVRDGEGATKLINIIVNGGKNDSQVKKIAKSIANSALFKTAMYGNDPNWGRIIMAIGKTYEKIKPQKVNIYFGKILVVKNGLEQVSVSNGALKKYLKKENILIKISLGLGKAKYDIQTCDFSHGYVDINASYKS